MSREAVQMSAGLATLSLNRKRNSPKHSKKPSTLPARTGSEDLNREIERYMARIQYAVEGTDNIENAGPRQPVNPYLFERPTTPLAHLLSSNAMDTQATPSGRSNPCRWTPLPSRVVEGDESELKENIPCESSMTDVEFDRCFSPPRIFSSPSHPTTPSALLVRPSYAPASSSFKTPETSFQKDADTCRQPPEGAETVEKNEDTRYSVGESSFMLNKSVSPLPSPMVISPPSRSNPKFVFRPSDRSAFQPFMGRSFGESAFQFRPLLTTGHEE